jgi:hypothetical protein
MMRLPIEFSTGSTLVTINDRGLIYTLEIKNNSIQIWLPFEPLESYKTKIYEV